MGEGAWSPAFSERHRRACAVHGIDIERSYQDFLTLLLGDRARAVHEEVVLEQRVARARRRAELSRRWAARQARGEPAAPGAFHRRPDTRPTGAPLTASELHLLCGLATGGSARTVGATLGMKPLAAGSAVKVIREKLGALNTAHAVAIALRAGLIRWSDDAHVEPQRPA